jgi:nucleotide-binding universal stress UspA family protein
MIPKIKRILYTTDLSESARFAFSYAATIANQFDAKVVILHVLEDISANIHSQVSSMIGENRWAELQKQKEEAFFQTIEARLNEFCHELKSEYGDTCPFVVEEPLVEQGNAVEQILKISEEKNCDLIVMGTHGYGMLADALIGSTARRVVRRSRIPVMVIRLPE